jgi:hypothetical protein
MQRLADDFFTLCFSKFNIFFTGSQPKPQLPTVLYTFTCLPKRGGFNMSSVTFNVTEPV